MSVDANRLRWASAKPFPPALFKFGTPFFLSVVDIRDEVNNLLPFDATGIAQNDSHQCRVRRKTN